LKVGELLAAAGNPHPTLSDAGWFVKLVSETQWDGLNEALAAHRLGPLLCWRLRQCDADVPAEVQRCLTALYLQRKHQAERVFELAADITQALDEVSIPCVVLKGAALAHMAYAEPGLRPMDDIDMLVAPADMPAANDVLERLGLNVRQPNTRAEKWHHHWPAAVDVRTHPPLFVEMHHAIYSKRLGKALTLAQLQSPITRLTYQGRHLYAMHPEEFLETQIKRMAHLTEPFRGVFVSDVIGLAEYQFDRFDWERVCSKNPKVRQVFAALQELTPLSDKLCDALDISRQVPKKPRSLDRCGYQGWPYRKEKSSKVAWETLTPNPWWARIAYGKSSGSFDTCLVRFFYHPLNLLKQTAIRLLNGSLAQ